MEQTRNYQTHFLRYLLDGKDEIVNEEAELRKKQLGLNLLELPCFVVCVAPDYSPTLMTPPAARRCTSPSFVSRINGS